jgi:hypothetical protein
MKKIVPDPPPSKPSARFYTINNDIPSIDAIIHSLQLLCGIEDILDEYICGNADVPGIGMLVNTVQQVQMTKALTELVLYREAGEITWH